MKDKTIKNAMNDIEKIILDVYSQGYNDGIKDGKESVQIDDSTAYEQGLNDAWECARRIDNDYDLEQYLIDSIESKSYIERCDLFNQLSPQECMAKIKEYEEKQTEKAEIKVGDEVIYHGDGVHDGSVGVVIGVEKDWREVRFKSSWNSVGIHKDTLTKTGRHFPQIEEVLEQMKGEE